MMKIGQQQISLETFTRAIQSDAPLEIDSTVLERITQAHDHALAIATGEQAVYGLNTGLGANLGHRLAPEEIPEFQYQIIAGRAVACGQSLSADIGRGVLLSRILSAANGHSGMSPELFKHLCVMFNTGISPAIPEYGSIGASDLTQNAAMGLSVCGDGHVWFDGRLMDSAAAYTELGLQAHPLKPKDGLSLINHSGVSVSLSALALHRCRGALDMLKTSVVLSYVGYDANRLILSEEANALRGSPGQSELARWLVDALSGASHQPRRIQEALSYRTVAPVIGAAEAALSHAVNVWTDEANGSPDSPAVLANGAVLSTPNFHTPALALAMENVSLSLVGVANGALQRMQRMMTPALSDLPRYLSPIEGGSAGFVPMQKTALSLLAEISLGAQPAMLNPIPVSDSVEDMATMTPQIAMKLDRQLKPLEYLSAIEALVASQAIDLRQPEHLGKVAGKVHPLIREEVDALSNDRSSSPDVETVRDILKRYVSSER